VYPKKGSRAVRGLECSSTAPGAAVGIGMGRSGEKEAQGRPYGSVQHTERKVELERVRLDVRKHLFSKRAARHWHSCP